LRAAAAFRFRYELSLIAAFFFELQMLQMKTKPISNANSQLHPEDFSHTKLRQTNEVEMKKSIEGISPFSPRFRVHLPAPGQD
jgi:hypothetical protein